MHVLILIKLNLQLCKNAIFYRSGNNTINPRERYTEQQHNVRAQPLLSRFSGILLQYRIYRTDVSLLLLGIISFKLRD